MNNNWFEADHITWAFEFSSVIFYFGTLIMFAIATSCTFTNYELTHFYNESGYYVVKKLFPYPLIRCWTFLFSFTHYYRVYKHFFEFHTRLWCWQLRSILFLVQNKVALENLTLFIYQMTTKNWSNQLLIKHANHYSKIHSPKNTLIRTINRR